MFFCVRTEDLFVGVRSFSSRVFCASGMANAWLVLPPSPNQARDCPMQVASGSGPPAEAVVTNGETCFEWKFVAHLSTFTPGGAAAESVRPSGLVLAPPAAGDCGLCQKALMSFEKCWTEGICNRCYNARKGGATCQGPCGKGLWKPEVDAGFDRCCDCHRYACKHCDTTLAVDEVRYANRCCNRCYNLKEKKSTDPCRGCQKGLLRPEQAKSAWCGQCWQRWRSEGGR